MKPAKSILLKTLSAVIILLLAFPMPALPAGNGNGQKIGNGNGSIKVGHISYFTGEVFVRSKGQWKTLTTTPCPIYNTDRVATKSGRANIVFIDGSVMRMNTDTSLRIVKYEGSGSVFKGKKESSTQVDVLVGDIWFNVKTQKETRFGFRSPSMTAAIRGTEGNLAVGPDRQTNFILSSGASQNEGVFTQYPSDSDAKFGTDIKPSSPQFLSSPLVKAMDDAVVRAHQAELSEAKTALAAAEVKTIQAASTEQIQTKLASARVGMGMAKAEEAEASARAYFVAARESMEIAEYLGDKAAVAAAQEDLNAAKMTLNKVVALKEEAVSLVRTLNYTTSSPKLATALSALVESVADTAKAYSSVVRAEEIAVIAHSSGLPSIAEAAAAQAEIAIAFAEKAENARSTISTLIGGMTEGIDNGKGQAIVTATLIVAESISVHSSAAEAQVNVAVELVSGDSRTLALAEQTATTTGQLSSQASNMASPIEIAAAVNNEDNTKLSSILISIQVTSSGAESLVTPESLPNTTIAPLPSEPAPVETAPTTAPATEEPTTEEPAPDLVTGSLGGGGTGDPNISPYTF